MQIINPFSCVRKLAKQDDSQITFSASKELNGVKLFLNEHDLSKLQRIYINYLYFYYNLQQDIQLKEVNKKVLEDEIYEDAYSYYKSKVDKSKKKQNTGSTIRLTSKEE